MFFLAYPFNLIHQNSWIRLLGLFKMQKKLQPFFDWLMTAGFYAQVAKGVTLWRKVSALIVDVNT